MNLILVEIASSRLARLKDECSCGYSDELMDVARLEKRDWQMMIVDRETSSADDKDLKLMKDCLR